jgi:hypothetical protein
MEVPPIEQTRVDELTPLLSGGGGWSAVLQALLGTLHGAGAISPAAGGQPRCELACRGAHVTTWRGPGFAGMVAHGPGGTDWRMVLARELSGPRSCGISVGRQEAG